MPCIAMQPATPHPPPDSLLSVFYTVVIEERHGFNKQTKALFFSDVLKSMLLGLVLMPPLVGGFTWLLQRVSPWLPLQLWAFFFVVAIVMMTIYPICKTQQRQGFAVEPGYYGICL